MAELNTNVSDNKNAPLLIGQLSRMVELAKGILVRLDNGDELSSVLSAVRGLASLDSNAEGVGLIDRMIYGQDNTHELASQDHAIRVKTREKYESIFGVRNPREVAKMISQGKTDMSFSRSHVLAGPVHSLEGKQSHSIPGPFSSDEAHELYAQQLVLDNESKAALNRARAEVYRLVFDTWSRASFERDALSLLGPDYRTVLDSVMALDTVVGEELQAALGELRYTNPANWAQAAGGCRSVIIKLGKLLWRGPLTDYDSAFHDKRIVLKPDGSNEREVNRLCAHVEEHFKGIPPDNKKLQKEADDLLHNVYNKGSTAKRGSGAMTYSEAQKLVVDTFRFVAILEEVGALGPE